MLKANDARLILALTEVYGTDARSIRLTPTSGGSINAAYAIELDNGERCFGKFNRNADAYPGIFIVEKIALEALAKAGSMRVPQALFADEHCILTELVTFGDKAKNWRELCGQQLAELHDATQWQQFGFAHDNYLGLSKQINTWHDDAFKFWYACRFEPQVRALVNVLGQDDAVVSMLNKVPQRMEALCIGNNDEPAVLLHGDLWTGNAAADENGAPVVYDPASYYGQREAEFGMMRLFGGFGPVVEAAYAEIWPFLPGSEQRIAIYRIYHEINHLLLFGRSYYETVRSSLMTLI